MVNRRKFLLGCGGTVVSPFVCKAYAERIPELELILALDESASVFEGRVPHWGIQLQGHIYALAQKEVRESLLDGKAYLRIVTWSDSERPVRTIFEKQMISASSCDAAIAVLAENVANSCSGSYCPGTNHYWLVQQVSKMKRMAYRTVLDVSTDQVPYVSSKLQLDVARAVFEKQNGTINALAVKMGGTQQAVLQSELCSSHGFCFSANADAQYAEALKSKIISEIA